MIDNLVLALTHGLLMLTALLLLRRPDLDDENAPPPATGRTRRWGKPSEPDGA